jgi:2-polyprenyl-3-methyl-5-hydroxy-6-metoxy-1,4-benzoquinol methylase
MIPRRPIDIVSVTECPSCGCSERSFLYEGQEHEYENTTDQIVSFYRCAGCGLMYLDPRPAITELHRIYPSNYYSQVSANASPDALNLKSLVGRLVKSRVLARVDGNLRPHIALGPQHTFLDIGCGGGRLLRCVQVDSGCDAYGIDFDLPEDVARRFSEPPLVLLRSDFLSHDFGSLRFDVIYAAHLIEHLPNPLDFLRKCHSLLTDDGILVIETPNEACLPRKLFGRYWGGNHFPRHWFLFNPETARAAAKHAVGNGLECLAVHQGATSFFWIWTGHAILLRWKMKALADLLFPSDHRIATFSILNVVRHGFFTFFDIVTKWLTGQSGVMAVVFRKCAEAAQESGEERQVQN